MIWPRMGLNLFGFSLASSSSTLQLPVFDRSAVVFHLSLLSSDVLFRVFLLFYILVWSLHLGVTSAPPALRETFGELTGHQCRSSVPLCSARSFSAAPTSWEAFKSSAYSRTLKPTCIGRLSWETFSNPRLNMDNFGIPNGASKLSERDLFTPS